MSLIIDNRAAIGDGSGTHALVIGVSEYPFLAGGATPVSDPWDMGQLTSTASSAHKIFEWLKTALLPQPLATCRLLLSPSPGETTLAGIADPATLANVLHEAEAWRTDASSNRENVTFFYFAGHGVQRTKEDAVLCLHDFRGKPGPALMRAVDLGTIRAGMSPAPGRLEIARTQFYFVDACRVQPERFVEFEPLQTTGVFDKDLGGEDNRSSPIFYSSISNKQAMALPGRQTLFSQAVLECLAGAVGDSVSEDDDGNPEWRVSVSALSRGIEMRTAELNRQLGADQTYTTGGQFKEATICRLPGPPMVDVQVSIDPVDACAVGTLAVTGHDDVVAVSRTAPLTHPIRERLPAGLYNVVLTFRPPTPPFVDRKRLQQAVPPRAVWKVRVL